jgi:large subunit ribosomal protein LP0
MGKNTMMKRSIKEHCKRTGNEDWMNLAELLVGNVGVIFTTVRCRRCSCFA